MKPITLFLTTALFVSLSPAFGSKLGLKNFRELPAAYSTVTQIPANLPAIQVLFKKVQSRLPQKGEVEEMSSPMLLAAYELAGGYCGALVDLEVTKPAAERVLFKDVDFSAGPKQFTPALQNLLLNQLSENFWFRSPTETEMKELDSFFAEIRNAGGTSTTDTKQIAFLLCSYFGTSLQFLVD